MNNLHRSLAPISDAAWTDLEAEVRRTFVRSVAGRRIVDMPEAAGLEFSALGTGRVRETESGVAGVRALAREVLPVVELRVPFSLARSEIDDVARGAADPDWKPAQDAAVLMAQAEDRTVFRGSASTGVRGIARASTNDPITLPTDLSRMPAAVAKAITELRLAGVAGPYSLLLSAELFTEVAETTDQGYPIHDHLAHVLDGEIIWAPALDGALLVSGRGGDYALHLGQDLSIGYDSHDAEHVNLYLEESLVFRVLTPEAAVALTNF